MSSVRFRNALPLIVSVFSLWASVAPAQGAPSPRTISVDAAVKLAFERSPNLIGPRAEVSVAQARYAGATRFLQNNPQVTGTAGPRLPDSGERPIDLTVNLSQTVDLLSRGPRVDAAGSALESAQMRFESERIGLAVEVRESFGAALAAEQRVSVVEQALKLAQDAVATTEARLAAGASSRLEVNASRVELGRAARERAIRIQERATTFGRLKLLLGLPPEERLTLQGRLEELVKPPSVLGLQRDDALSKRPDLQAARQSVVSAEGYQRVAFRESLPVPSVGLTYMVDERTPVVQGMVGLTLPLFNQNQQGRGEAAAETERARGELQALDRAARTEVELSLSRFEAAQSAADQYAGPVIKAVEENLGLASEAYRAGKLSFPELLILRRETLDSRRGYIDALEELNAAKAQVLKAFGRFE